MKKIGLLLMSVTLLFGSCKDYLNMPPKNVKVVYTMEDVKETMSTYLFAITNSSAGATLNKYVRFNGKNVQFPFTRHVNTAFIILTNDLDLSDFLNLEDESPSWGGKGLFDEYVGSKNWDSNKIASRLWTEVFVNVGYLNMTLKDLENAPDFNQETYDRVSGEARVARAYYMLQLNQLFAPMTMNDYGIPFNFDADVIKGGARWKQTELYKKLIGEIKDVLDYKTPPKTSWNIFYNKRIMYAILAQAYRYKAYTCAAEDSDWANAEHYASEARAGERMANTAEEVKELATVPLNTVVDKPHKFALLRIALYASAADDYAPWGEPEDKFYQFPSAELLSLYDETDLRIGAYFQKNEELDRYNVSRYGFTIPHNINDSHVLFSFAELLLIEAEAALKQGNSSKATTLLNEFKSSRIPGYAGYTGGDLIGEIFNERRKEFAFEGLSNWVDMKIVGKEIKRLALDETDNLVKYYSLTKDDYRYTLPIPAEEELKYNNIPQNPGWK